MQNTSRFRKSLGAAAVAVLALGGLTACGNDTESGPGAPGGSAGPVVEISAPTEPVELEVWGGLGGPDGETMMRLVSEINEAEPNLEVTMIMQPEFDTTVRTAAMTDSLPHGAIFADPVQWAANGFVSPMPDFAELTGVDGGEFPPAVWGHAVMDGERYGVPLDVQPITLFWNKALFEQAGLDPEARLESKDDFLAAAEALSNVDGINAIGIPAGGLTPLVWTSLAYQGGLEFTNEEQTEATFNSEAGVQAAEFLRLLVEEGYSPANLDVDAELSDFIRGVNGMVFAGVWETTRLAEALGDDLGAAFMPSIFGDGTWGSSQHMVTFDRDMTDAERSALYYFFAQLSDRTAEWAVGGSLPARATVRASEEFQALMPQSLIADGLDTVRPTPNFPGAPDLIFGVGGAAEAVVAHLTGAVPDVRSALDEAAATYTTILQDD